MPKPHLYYPITNEKKEKNWDLLIAFIDRKRTYDSVARKKNAESND